MDSLKDQLKLKDEEAARLREHLGIPSSSTVNVTPTKLLKTSDLQDQVLTLRQQVKDMNKVNSVLRQQVGQTSAVDESQEGFSPQMLVSMAAEMERLKAENVRLNTQLVTAEGSGAKKGSAVQELSLSKDAYDGNGLANSEATSSLFWERNGHPSDSSDHSQSPGSPQFPMESYSQDLSHNTNRHTGSSVSQLPSYSQLESFSQVASQLSQSDSEWAPRLMGGEGQGGGKPPWLAKMKLPASDSACSQPLVNVGRKLQDAQEQVGSATL